MLILALLLRAFQPPKPASSGCATVFPGAENKNRCILLCSVGYIYVAQIPFSGFGGRKGTSSRAKMSILEVLRLRAHKRCVTR
jgi:hypothetical protein